MKSNPTTALVICQGESTPKVSSLTIAESFGKNHRDVLRRINALIVDLPAAFNERNFAPVEYEDGKGQWRPQYLLTRDAFSLLVMGFTGPEALAWKLRYIEAFNAMEKELLGQRLLAAPEGRALIQEGLRLARRLTPRRRKEIKRALHYHGLGLSNPEIAETLFVGVNTVKTHLKAAYRKTSASSRTALKKMLR